jgi:monoamine oxidase
MQFTRRTLIAGLALAPALPSRAESTHVDAVVIGAGGAGLAAAHALRAAGRSVVVIEARDRVGGRVHTETRLSAPFDAGAQYIHWAERNPWTKIASDLGVATEEERGGALVVYANGRPLPDADRSRRWRAFAQIDAAIAAHINPDCSIAEAAATSPDLANSAAGLTLLTLGEEADRVSCADYDQLWSGDDLVMREGYGGLLTRYASGLPIRFGQPVRGIDWSGAGLVIDTAAGSLRARAAIVTVPIGVLHAEGIRFTPALPAETRDAIAGLEMGAYTKVALALDPARLRGLTYSDTIDIDPAGGTTSFEFMPFGRPLAIAYFGGDYARHLCESGERASVAHLTDRLVALFGSGVRDAISGGALTGWWTDPFARGSYSIAKPGHLGARDALRRPVANRLWFAGEASAGGGAMTVGGAHLEGARAAGEVIRMLAS